MPHKDFELLIAPLQKEGQMVSYKQMMIHLMGESHVRELFASEVPAANSLGIQSDAIRPVIPQAPKNPESIGMGEICTRII